MVIKRFKSMLSGKQSTSLDESAGAPEGDSPEANAARSVVRDFDSEREEDRIIISYS
jgi:hypothetical protein